MKIIGSNTGVLVFKFGAEWCKPCAAIKPLLDNMIPKLPGNVTVYVLDIDECFDLYSYLRHFKMVNGIPCMLVYYKDNRSYAPDENYAGTDTNQIVTLFNKVIIESRKYGAK
jgi:thiol-disulfide isomerase/thioredoxin